MIPQRENRNDNRMELFMGKLLRAGVISSAILVIFGGILFFYQHRADSYDYSVFSGQPEKFRSVPLILKNALDLRGRAVIQTGLLVLIATPILRVFFSLLYFLFEKDWIYVAVTVVVLAVLVNSLITV